MVQIAGAVPGVVSFPITRRIDDLGLDEFVACCTVDPQRL
jgi:hypothetical protein